MATNNGVAVEVLVEQLRGLNRRAEAVSRDYRATAAALRQVRESVDQLVNDTARLLAWVERGADEPST